MDSNNHTRRNLWVVTAGQRLRYVAAIAAIGASNACMLAAPVVAGYALDVISERDFAVGAPMLAGGAAWLVEALGDGVALGGRDATPAAAETADASGPGKAASDAVFIAYLALSALAALALVGVGALFMYLRGRWTAIAAEDIARRLRDELYRRLHYLPASFFDAADTGDLVQRCSSDVETMRMFLTSHVVEIGRSLLMVAAMTPILFLRDAQLAWFAVSLMPILAIGAFLFFSKVRRQFQIADEAEGAMTAVLQENLAGIRVVRAFARQAHEMERFGVRNRAYRDAFYRVNTLEAMYWGISNSLAMGQIGLVLIAGGMFLADGAISVGGLFVFVSLVTMVVFPVRRLGEVLTDSSKAIVALGRINHILETEEESRERPPHQARATGEVVFDMVRAGYKPDRAAVVDFCARIPSGQTVGIVGPPGSGKTTLVRLLMRLYPFHTGRILIDGVDVREVDRQWLRQQIGVVLQDPFLYSRSIAANLRVARPEAADSELRAVAQEAAVHDAIVDFPAGYEAQIGERGLTLSGGQRQRLALARALLKEPPILVLDDSLSAVDTGTERRILDALERRRGRHTTIVIAHRLSSVRRADRILVMEHGRLVQDGAHDKLAEAPGPYRRLCEIQGLLDESISRDLARGAADAGGQRRG